MSKKRIVLFNPIGWEVSEELISSNGFESTSGVPLSILSVATLLDLEKYDVIVISGSEKGYFEKIHSVVTDKCICLGISSMTGYQIKQGLNVAKAVRAKHPSIPIVWGGCHPSILTSDTLKSEYVDIVVRGYGETTFAELVERLSTQQSLESVKGISFKTDSGKVVHNDERHVEDINNYPMIPYSLVDVSKFLTPEIGDKTIGYISSRGCPNRCSFCADRVLYKGRWNALSAERVLGELDELILKYGIDAVRFMDSNFFVSENRVAKICKGFIERGLSLKWGRVNGSAEILVRYNKETWQLMRDAGCSSIAVGVESGYDKSLETLNKKADQKDVLKLAELANNFDIRLLYTFMLGVPIDLANPEEQRRHFVKELSSTLTLMNRLMDKRQGYDRPVLFRFALYPGSALYDECRKNGWNDPETFEEWSDVTLFDAPLPWLTEDETNIIDAIVEIVKSGYPPLTLGKISRKIN